MKLQSHDILLFLSTLYVTRYRSKRLIMLELVAGMGFACVFVKEWVAENGLVLARV